jgi:hypothetical protein
MQSRRLPMVFSDRRGPLRLDLRWCSMFGHGYLRLSQPFPAVMRARRDLLRAPLERVGT